MTAPPYDAVLEHFKALLASRLGLSFDAGRPGYLPELLNRRLEATGADANTYLRELENADHPRAPEGEWAELARLATIGETYFFRHAQQFEALSGLLRERYAARREPPRLLSAGCASGEEPYSLAMLLREILPDRAPSVTAFDLNQGLIERAVRARYSAWSMRETPERMLRRWFQSNAREFCLDPVIRDDVTFCVANLAADDEPLLAAEQYDVIFCRNVLMYFDPECCRQAVARLKRALKPGGHLFLGSAETLRGISHDFHLCQSHDAFYYRVKASEESAAPAFTEPVFSADRAVRAPAAPLPLASEWFEVIGRAAARVEALATEKLFGGAPLAAAAPKPTKSAWASARADLRESLDLLRREEFSKALSAVRSLPAHAVGDPDVLLLEGVLLASAGDFAGAESVSLRLLAIDDLNAGAHYVLGLCDAGAGRVKQAVEHHRTATYLDPDFAMPHLQLGLLLARSGDKKGAELELRHARALFEREDAARLLMFGGGFGRGVLLDICSAELVRIGGVN